MFRLFVIITAISATCTGHAAVRKIDSTLNNRIVGGHDAPNGAFPFIVSLMKTFLGPPRHTCGGSIINERYVVTSATCINRSDSAIWTILAGTNQLNSSSGVKYNVSQIIVHENYTNTYENGTVINDIALLRTATPINLSHENISAVNLSQQDVGVAVDVILAGWGALEYEGNIPNNLQVLNAHTISYETCKNSLPYCVHESHVCAFATSSQGACHEDVGGPLVNATDNTLVGMLSWGIACARGYPDVYTRVYSFLDWINANAQLNK